ncbi:hypothetical protein DPEC_G00154950 [Dallia pectoralis]|uniref:Uncharacterized protein n=1 Tax=Dallia pectoralis TaxID=75939 RepID=A0ACC2GKB5_DALPE|nr:hypothetical protein DPEC_G00154950 [Dallia pectoralis]
MRFRSAWLPQVERIRLAFTSQSQPLPPPIAEGIHQHARNSGSPSPAFERDKSQRNYKGATAVERRRGFQISAQSPGGTAVPQSLPIKDGSRSSPNAPSVSENSGYIKPTNE